MQSFFLVKTCVSVQLTEEYVRELMWNGIHWRGNMGMLNVIRVGRKREVGMSRHERTIACVLNLLVD